MISAKRFDNEFLDIMREIAKAQGVTIENLIEAWCIRRLAKDQAELRVYGHLSEPMLETAKHGKHTLRGVELYQWLLRIYEQDMEKEVAAELEDSKIKYGIPLTEHEQEIMERVKS